MTKLFAIMDSLKWGHLLAGVAMVSALTLLLAACASSASPAPPIQDVQASGTSLSGFSQETAIQSDLPDFPLILYQREDLVGSGSPTFTSLLGTKPVLLNYWASNCAPCKAEMPVFQKVWEKYQDRVLFLGLDVGRFFGFGDQEDSKRELTELGITYAAGTVDSIETAYKLKVLGLPTTVFVTPAGKIQKKWVGVLNESKLTELVEDLLEAS